MCFEALTWPQITQLSLRHGPRRPKGSKRVDDRDRLGDRLGDRDAITEDHGTRTSETRRPTRTRGGVT